MLKERRTNQIILPFKLTIVKSIAYVVVMFLIMVIFSFIAYIFMDSLERSNLFYDMLMGEVVILSTYFIIMGRYYFKHKQRFTFKTYAPFKMLHLAPLTLLFVLFILIGLDPLFQILSLKQSQLSLGDFINLHPILALIMILVLAPIFEEIIFRGIILKGLLRAYKPSTGIVVSALLFGVFHLTWTQLISASILGILLGIVYYKTKSLLYPILVHFLANFLFIFIELTALVPLPNLKLSLIIGIVSLFIIIFYLNHLVKHVKTASDESTSSYLITDIDALALFYEEE